MKTRTLAAFVIGLAAAGFASAQEVSLRATVPFSFVVGNKTMPAGEYRVSMGVSQGTTIIHGAGVAAVSLTIPAVDQSGGAKTSSGYFAATATVISCRRSGAAARAEASSL